MKKTSSKLILGLFMVIVMCLSIVPVAYADSGFLGWLKSLFGGGDKITGAEVVAVCGNGIVETGEQCDDGGRCGNYNQPGFDIICSTVADCGGVGDGECKARSIDGCSYNCLIERGYKCPQTGGACTRHCGNGQLDDLTTCQGVLIDGCFFDDRLPEQCDDNNLIGSPIDGCDVSCRIAKGWECTNFYTGSNAGTGPSVCNKHCGNCRIDDGVNTCQGVAIDGCYLDIAETCEDAADPTLFDGCKYNCLIGRADVWALVDTNSDGLHDTNCAPAQVCGNGVIEGTEQCDDGDLTTPQTCGVGACQRTVADICINSGLPNECTTVTCVPGTPKAESCNGIDDDCNGVVDDGISCCGTKLYDPNVQSCLRVEFPGLYAGVRVNGVNKATGIWNLFELIVNKDNSVNVEVKWPGGAGKTTVSNTYTVDCLANDPCVITNIVCEMTVNYPGVKCWTELFDNDGVPDQVTGNYVYSSGGDYDDVRVVNTLKHVYDVRLREDRLDANKILIRDSVDCTGETGEVVDTTSIMKINSDTKILQTRLYKTTDSTSVIRDMGVIQAGVEKQFDVLKNHYDVRFKYGEEYTWARDIDCTPNYDGNPLQVDDVCEVECNMEGSSLVCEAVSAQVCGNNIVEGTEECDGGDCCDVDCTFKTTGTECRAAAGVCDIAETCTGSSATCPADTFQPSSVLCRGVAGVCDEDEFCTGSSAACPVDAKKPATIVCRPATDVCDVAENCDGSSNDCPADAKAQSSTPCDDKQFCSLTDHCDGNGLCIQLTARDCSDTVPCTDDSCDEVNDKCVNTPNDNKCPEDAWVNLGDPYWVSVPPCDRELRQDQEYRDYYCDSTLDCQYTVTQTRYIVVQYEDNDQDDDGVCDDVDKCPDTDAWYAEERLNPNHYDSSNWDVASAYGCSCEQVLYCKPGADNGEYKYGCAQGTKNIWEAQNGWAPDCQVNGIVANEGESKPLFENTDGAGLPDLLSGDNDGDGVSDGSDVLPDDADPVGTSGSGKPDWWEKKHPGK